MGFIITTRNPRTKKLVVIVEDTDAADPAEFETEEEARALAETIPLCKAWGFDVIEV